MKSSASRKKYYLYLFALIIVAGLSLSYINIRSNAVGREQFIYVPTGSTYNSLMDTLRANPDAVKNLKRFNTTAKLTGLDNGVRPGRYFLGDGMNYLDVAHMFQRGLQTPARVTFNNIKTLPQLAGRVSRQIETDSITLAEYLTSDSIAAKFGFEPHTFISMFIPETYEFYWTVKPAGFVDRMKSEYDRFWSTGQREEKLTEIGLTRIQAVTLASIVYEETKMSDEMPIVAGVYMNRLRIGMPLQADPTVKFAVGDFSLRRVLFSHLRIDSPYNTYMYKGLPPGPICMPSVAAVDAVLSYVKTDYLYFVARDDFSGYHTFSKTLAEHNRKAQLYINELNRRGIR